MGNYDEIIILVQCITMSFVQLRITPCEIMDVSKVSFEDLKIFHFGLQQIVTDTDGDYVCCYEKLNKFGEATKPHFHASFEYADTVLKNTLAKKIKNVFFKLGLPKFKGNKQYSLQVIPEPDDYQRWFRYCLKERYIKDLTKTDMDIEKLEMLAKDERKRAVQSNILNREKTLNKITLYDRLKKSLEDLNLKKGTTRKQVFCHVLSYYRKENKALNPTTMRGYADLYMIEKEWITPSMYYDLNFK